MPRSIGMPFACLALSYAGAAVAAQAPTPPEVVVVTTNAKPVCKSERSLSSRVVKRTCKTAAEWHRDSLDARNKLKLGAKSQTTEAFKRPSSP